MGIGCGWLAPAIKRLLQDSSGEISANSDEASWIASLYDFGKMLGSILTMTILDILGRSFMLRTGSALILLTWLVVIFTKSAPILVFARFAYGIAVGICDVVCAIYLGENCTPKIRGISCCLSVFSFFFAVLLAFVLGTYLPYTITSIVSAIISSVCLLSGILLVESPHFLTIRGKFDKAEGNLMWLRGSQNTEQVRQEYESIKVNVEFEKQKKSSYKELFAKSANLKSLILVLVISISQPATGSASIFSYISIMFPSNEFVTSNNFTVWFGTVQLISATVCVLVIEKVNRRSLALLSNFVFLLCHMGIAFFYYANDHSTMGKYNSWLIFILIGIYSLFQVATDSVFYLVRSELFPQSIKPIGCGLSIIAESVFDFVTVKAFLMIAETYGMYVNFVIYAIFSLLTFLFCYFALPETKGKSLIHIQHELEKTD